MKRLLALLLGGAVVLSIVACNEADTVSYNISQEADKFEIPRRVVFINGITDNYILSIEGYCSLGNDRTEYEISVTCEVAPGQFKKHFLGISDNVTYLIEQLDAASVSRDHYKVIFKPSLIIPDIEVR